MNNEPSLGDILGAALKKKDTGMDKIVNFYRARKDLGWSAIEILGALNTEQFAKLEAHILKANSPPKLQRIKLHAAFGADRHWQENKIPCIRMVRACGQNNLFGLIDSKNFCEGYGVLNVTHDEFQRLVGIFGRSAIDCF